MTTTDTTAPQGADLARQALAHAIAAAKNAPKKPRRRPPVLTGKRRKGDPMLFGDAITKLIADRAWEAQAAGGSILDQWATIAPELVGKVGAEHWDASARCLHLRPVSPAFGTLLRLNERQIIERINAKATGVQVAAIRVLVPGDLPEPVAPSAGSVGPVAAPAPCPEAPAKTREDGSEGFQRAMAVVLEGRTAGQADPRQELRDRYFGGHRDQLREPADNFAETLAVIERQEREAAIGADPRMRALARLRAEQNGWIQPAVERPAGMAEAS